MKDKEICFIICTNNRTYAEECIYYINHLYIPDGYTIDVLTVEDAKSMTAGYNEAMNYSEAKYKVYLHQDTFIVNRDFIRDMLAIFQSDDGIGMIGNVGVPDMPLSGVMWDGQEYGMLYEQHIYETQLLSHPLLQDELCMDVEAIDGFIMMTQYDLPWREDVFDKWDMYDASQSMEFIKAGYRVVIPHMEKPWCVHDCGFLHLESYEDERNKYIGEYLAGKYADAFVDKVAELILTGEYDAIEQYLNLDGPARINSILYIVHQLHSVYKEEKCRGIQTIYSKVSNLQQLMERFDKLKFLLTRIDFGYAEEDMGELSEFVNTNKVTAIELLKQVELNTVHTDKVIEKIANSGLLGK